MMKGQLKQMKWLKLAAWVIIESLTNFYVVLIQLYCT